MPDPMLPFNKEIGFDRLLNGNKRLKTFRQLKNLEGKRLYDYYTDLKKLAGSRYDKKYDESKRNIYLFEAKLATDKIKEKLKRRKTEYVDFKSIKPEFEKFSEIKGKTVKEIHSYYVYLNDLLGYPYTRKYIGVKKQFFLRDIARNHKTINRLLRNRPIRKFIQENKYEKALQFSIDNKQAITPREFKDIWRHLANPPRDKRYLITYYLEGDDMPKYLTVTPIVKDFVKNIFLNHYVEEKLPTTGSDPLDNVDIRKIKRFMISTVRQGRRLNRQGSFFRFYHDTTIDLTRYQIYNKQDAYKYGAAKHCLSYALSKLDIPQAQIQSIETTIITGASFPKKHLFLVADIINRDIVLYEFRDRLRKVTYKVKTEHKDEQKGETIYLALHENHYFVYEKTIYTRFSVKNYDNINHINDWHKIYRQRGNGYKKSNTSPRISSLELVRLLDSKFKPLDMTKFDISAQYVDKQISLDNISREQREFKIKKLNSSGNNIWFADFESFVHNNKHEMYLLGYCDISNDFVRIRDAVTSKPKNIMYGFLSDMTRGGRVDAVCYFHNLKYDYQIMKKYLHIVKQISRSGSVYSVKVNFLRAKVLFKDSYKVIPTALSKMPGMFNLEARYRKKEAIAYKYFTPQNHNKIVPIDEYAQHLLPDKKEILYNELNNLKPIREIKEVVQPIITNEVSEFEDEDLMYDSDDDSDVYIPESDSEYSDSGYEIYDELDVMDPIEYKEQYDYVFNETKEITRKIYQYDYDDVKKTFNPTAYYMEYLEMDVLVLKKSIVKFREDLNTVTGGKCDLFDFLTISSIADHYCSINGSYENVYQIKGNLREYVSKAIYGGRVMANPRYEKKVITGKIADFDGVSLYPSAIDRLCAEAGIPKGKAKKMESKNFRSWNSYDYSIMTVKIKSVNKHQDMPFIAYKQEGKSTQYLNEPPPKPVVIDKYTLQDYINYHHIDYEILEGVYWNSGFNNKLGIIIRDLFQTRLNYKAQGKDSLQRVVKLMLNSCYGKCCIKLCKTENIITELSDDYIFNHYDCIKSFSKINDRQYEVTKLKADKGYNRAHAGVAILSYSKRIMNEVFAISSENQLPIFYTDTDSLHAYYDDIPILEAKFREQYNRELCGKRMGQFHIDFDLKGARGEIYATKSIFLGKKSYLDVLECKNPDGSIVRGYHKRLKGITAAGLEHAASEYKDSYFGLYSELAEGREKKILLNPKDENGLDINVLFKYENHGVITKEPFYRIVKF